MKIGQCKIPVLQSVASGEIDGNLFKNFTIFLRMSAFHVLLPCQIYQSIVSLSIQAQLIFIAPALDMGLCWKGPLKFKANSLNDWPLGPCLYVHELLYSPIPQAPANNLLACMKELKVQIHSGIAKEKTVVHPPYKSTSQNAWIYPCQLWYVTATFPLFIFLVSQRFLGSAHKKSSNSGITKILRIEIFFNQGHSLQN